MFGGLVVGRNVELVPNQRIVQAWRLAQEFPEGTYSLLKIELQAKDSGTRLKLDHTGFPEGHYDHLYEGWYSHYWEPLRKFWRNRFAVGIRPGWTNASAATWA